MNVMTSSMSCQASSPPFPSWMTSCRHLGTDATFGSGLSSSPQMRSSSALWPALIPVNSMPLLRSPHRNNAPGVSSLLNPLRSSAPDLRFFGQCPRDFSASPSVRMSSAPRSAARLPSSPTVTVKADGVTDSGSMLASTALETPQLPGARRGLTVPSHFFVIPGAGPPVDGTGAEL